VRITSNAHTLPHADQIKCVQCYTAFLDLSGGTLNFVNRTIKRENIAIFVKIYLSLYVGLLHQKHMPYSYVQTLLSADQTSCVLQIQHF